MYQRTFTMKRKFQTGAAKQNEKSMRLENEPKGKVTFDQFGWGKSTENKISEMPIQHVLPSTNAEEHVKQPSQKEIEAVNKGSREKENEIEAHVLLSNEEEHSMYRGLHVKIQNCWQDLMLQHGIDSAKKTGIALLPMVHRQTRKSSQETTQAECFQQGYFGSSCQMVNQ